MCKQWGPLPGWLCCWGSQGYYPERFWVTPQSRGPGESWSKQPSASEQIGFLLQTFTERPRWHKHFKITLQGFLHICWDWLLQGGVFIKKFKLLRNCADYFSHCCDETPSKNNWFGFTLPGGAVCHSREVPATRTWGAGGCASSQGAEGMCAGPQLTLSFCSVQPSSP